MQVLTEERKLIQDAAREFTRKRVLPLANKLDPEKGSMPRELIDEMAELGYFAILIPEEYGGLGLGAFEYCLVAEQLSRGWMSVASLIARGNGLIGALKSLRPEQKKVYLPRMARGEFLGAFSLSEPNAGSDVANITCRAVRDGDQWEITGSKYWCTFADQADFILVFARTDPKVDPNARHRGISAFMVEKPRGELPNGCQGSVI
ncbi:MAG: acyl-CoA dehydrogenase family protein, partial [Anaerolineales bacterium]